MQLFDILGLVAGFCTSVAFIPQVAQVYRNRSAKDISLGMYLIFVLGVILWLIYGLMTHAWPVMIANLVTLILAGTVLIMKLKWG